MCIHGVCIVRFYVFMHVSMSMYVFMPILAVCLKQCRPIVCVAETCRLALKVYMFVFVLFMVNMCNNFELYSCLVIFGYKFVWRNLKSGLLFTTPIRLYWRHFSANM